MRKFLLVVFTVIQTILCYGQDWFLPVTDSTTYFPIDFYKRDMLGTYKVDSIHLSWHSTMLAKFEEPKLFQPNVATTVLYRFTWLRSFHMPIVYSLYQQGDAIWLNTKVGNKVNLDNSYYDWEKLNQEEKEQFYAYQNKQLDSATGDFLLNKMLVRDTVPFGYITSVEKVPGKKLDELKRLLEKVNFWSLPPTDAFILGGDGATWIIEACVPGKGYHMVYRWSPSKKRDSQVWDIGNYIIALSHQKKTSKPVY